MTSLNDTRLRLFGPIVLFLIGTLFFRLNWYFELTIERLVRSDLIAISAGYICWNLTRWIVKWLQRRHPGYENTRRRLLRMALLMPLLINFAWLIRKLAQMAFNNDAAFWPTLSDYTYSLGIQIFYHFVYWAIYEGSYIMTAWRETFQQREDLKKAQLQSQLDTLKSQINPHFLFNSLNSLSMLIQDNPRQAETFVDEISSVYRYLLRSNEHELTSLGREIQFIESYFRLLKTRYGSGIDLCITVEDWQRDLKLPPLTLQLLVENAVKHNVILPDRPLSIEIIARQRQLSVRNNLQRKPVPILSHRVGLANIATKYRLLNQEPISIQEDDRFFVVTLPLLSGQPQNALAS